MVSCSRNEHVHVSLRWGTYTENFHLIELTLNVTWKDPTSSLALDTTLTFLQPSLLSRTPLRLDIIVRFGLNPRCYTHLGSNSRYLVARVLVMPRLTESANFLSRLRVNWRFFRNWTLLAWASDKILTSVIPDIQKISNLKDPTRHERYDFIAWLGRNRLHQLLEAGRLSESFIND